MAQIDVSKAVAAVDRAVGAHASVKQILLSQAELTKKAVDDALAADDAADTGSITAANAAIDEVAAKLSASTDDLLSAVVANPGSDPVPAPPA